MTIQGEHQGSPAQGQPAAIRRLVLWLTPPLAVTLAMTAGAGLFQAGIYNGNTPLMTAQLVGGDLVSLCVVLPVLIGSAILTTRGRAGALLVWLGTLCYLTYFYLVFAFHVRFNAFFLAYVVLLGGAVYGLAFGLASADPGMLRGTHERRSLARTVSISLGLVAVWFCLANLAETVPATCAGQAPSVVADFGAPTYFANAIDLAISLPAFALGAVYLWRRRPFGFVLAGMLLTLVVLVMLGLLSMFHVQMKRGIQVATVDLVVIGSMAVAYLGLLVWYLASTTREAGRA